LRRVEIIPARSISLPTCRAALKHTTQEFNDRSCAQQFGSILYEEGRYVEAERDCVRAVSILQERLGVENPASVAVTLHLASTYEARRRYSEAENLLLRALGFHEELFLVIL
jgi:tetratricopeptide (TPR) repeat protein